MEHMHALAAAILLLPGIFFMTVGMSPEPRVLADQPLPGARRRAPVSAGIIPVRAH